MKTAVDFMASELLYLDNEYDMKLINKNEYQAKRKEIIDQAKEMEETKKQQETAQLGIGAVIGSAYSDTDLQDRVNYWLDHYTRYGESHYVDTKDWRILEIYWDKILDRVLNELDITDKEVQPMADRISALF